VRERERKEGRKKGRRERTQEEQKNGDRVLAQSLWRG
jgi:hypothetical protein